MRTLEEIENTKISHSCESLIESYLSLRSAGFDVTIDNFFRRFMSENPPVERGATEKLTDLVTKKDTVDLPEVKYFRQVDTFTVHDYEQALKNYEQFFDCQYRAIEFVHNHFLNFIMANLWSLNRSYAIDDPKCTMSKEIISYAIRRRWLIRFADQYVICPKIQITVFKCKDNIVDSLRFLLNQQELDSYERQQCLGIWAKNVRAENTSFEAMS